MGTKPVHFPEKKKISPVQIQQQLGAASPVRRHPVAKVSCCPQELSWELLWVLLDGGRTQEGHRPQLSQQQLDTAPKPRALLLRFFSL